LVKKQRGSISWSIKKNRWLKNVNVIIHGLSTRTQAKDRDRAIVDTKKATVSSEVREQASSTKKTSAHAPVSNLEPSQQLETISDREMPQSERGRSTIRQEGGCATGDVNDAVITINSKRAQATAILTVYSPILHREII
jgi:hypothetical protein